LGGASIGTSRKDVRYFSLFRELDTWVNSEWQLAFWNINVGMAGKVRLPCDVHTVFERWLGRCSDRSVTRGSGPRWSSRSSDGIAGRLRSGARPVLGPQRHQGVRPRPTRWEVPGSIPEVELPASAPAARDGRAAPHRRVRRHRPEQAGLVGQVRAAKVGRSGGGRRCRGGGVVALREADADV
jgi:hypothetical protein